MLKCRPLGCVTWGPATRPTVFKHTQVCFFRSGKQRAPPTLTPSISPTVTLHNGPRGGQSNPSSPPERPLPHGSPHQRGPNFHCAEKKSPAGHQCRHSRSSQLYNNPKYTLENETPKASHPGVLTKRQFRRGRNPMPWVSQ